MNRKEGWERCLAELIRSRAFTPFKWGEHDCALFAADCIHAMTGVDVAASYRKRYQTEIGAMRIITKEGGIEAIAKKIITKYHLKQIQNQLMAKRGDIAMVRAGDNIAFGVVDLSGQYVISASLVGIERTPLSDVLSCFSIE